MFNLEKLSLLQAIKEDIELEGDLFMDFLEYHKKSRVMIDDLFIYNGGISFLVWLLKICLRI